MTAPLATEEANTTFLPAILHSSKLWQMIFIISILTTIICSQAIITTLAQTSPIEASNFIPNSTLPKVCLYEMGCLQGKHMTGLGTNNFEAFLGIPYALPPVGERRFAVRRF